MTKFIKVLKIFFLLLLCFHSSKDTNAQGTNSKFKVIAFFTGKDDLAHISFVHEANKWFPKMGKKYNFTYDSTNDWKNLNASFLSH